ncbi:MAG: alginate lyase family protein [Candidatus Omnitrophota bacterium]|nr:alginate lyase family protein [Candidatus Omnitrophota bacterium]
MRRFLKKDIVLGGILAKEYNKTKFYFDSADFQNTRKEFSRLFPDAEKNIIAKADDLRAHVFKIFHLDWNAGEKIDWHYDIVTGKRWPLNYYLDIDFRNADNFGEARFVWELNRHQHFLILGKAYLFTQDEKYAVEIIDEIMSWINGNPVYRGINWTSPLESGLRLISWCWAYKFIENSSSLTKSIKGFFLRSVFAQAEFIKDNLSLYSSANNHLIGEASALVITGLTFPEFKSSKCWVETGAGILFQEIKKQVYEDGVAKEQAFHYQGFIMNLFALAAVLLNKNDILVPEASWRRFFSMAEFVMNTMDMSGNVPNIGDSDDGMAIRLSDSKGFNIYKSLLCVAAIISQRGDFKARCGSFEEEHYWLSGMDGFNRYVSIEPQKQFLRSVIYKDGGYAILRNLYNNGDEKVFTMDCGELGYLSIAAHGHADLFSVTLSAYGAELLIDPGTYLYHRGEKWRNYFRSVKAHNTVEINNKNQSEPKGLFMWGKRPLPEIEEWRSSDKSDYISASYVNDASFHRRSVYFDKEKEAWTIKDAVEVDKGSVIKQYFHAASGSSAAIADRHTVEICNKGVFLYILADGLFSIDIKQGDEYPIAGWSSRSFGEKTKSPTIINSTIADKKNVFDTCLYVSRERLKAGALDGIFNSIKNRKAGA